MLIRDVELKPWPDAPTSWHMAEVPLAGNRNLLIFAPAPQNVGFASGVRPIWSIYANLDLNHLQPKQGTFCGNKYRVDHTRITSELEAQMVLDYYLTEYPP